MKTSIALLTILLFYASFAFSQTHKNTISIEAELSYPLNQPFQKNKAAGIGINGKGEHFFSKQFSGTLSLGYTYFKGELIYWNGKPDKNFALLPLLIGARYYVRNFYLGLEAGPAIKGSNNVNTNMAISPSFGYVYKRIDLGLHLLAIPALPSIPENTFLQKGGYSYLGIKLGYKVYRK